MCEKGFDFLIAISVDSSIHGVSITTPSTLWNSGPKGPHLTIFPSFQWTASLQWIEMRNWVTMLCHIFHRLCITRFVAYCTRLEQYLCKCFGTDCRIYVIHHMVLILSIKKQCHVLMTSCKDCRSVGIFLQLEICRWQVNGSFSITKSSVVLNLRLVRFMDGASKN